MFRIAVRPAFAPFTVSMSRISTPLYTFLWTSDIPDAAGTVMAFRREVVMTFRDKWIVLRSENGLAIHWCWHCRYPSKGKLASYSRSSAIIGQFFLDHEEAASAKSTILGARVRRPWHGEPTLLLCIEVHTHMRTCEENRLFFRGQRLLHLLLESAKHERPARKQT